MCTTWSLWCCNPPTWLILQHQARSLKYLSLNSICSVSQSHIQVKVKPAYVTVLYWASTVILGFLSGCRRFPNMWDWRLSQRFGSGIYSSDMWRCAKSHICVIFAHCHVFLYTNPLNLWHESSFVVLNSLVIRKLFVRCHFYTCKYKWLIISKRSRGKCVVIGRHLTWCVL
jgi:hypothetical protein